jgi:thiamine-phosphate diphosphorylase / hydroxyethylthiazole kinase
VEGFPKLRTVCIGGLNATNIQTVMYQSEASRPVDGIAVVSAVIAAADPEAEARHLQQLIKTDPPFTLPEAPSVASPESTIGELMTRSLGAIKASTPLSHNMTNLVVQNFAANVALAIGASPIMSSFGEEAGDLAKLGGALVLNMGTVTPALLANYLQALHAYNQAGRPVVFDPVGVGATAVRREAAVKVLSSGFVSVIKGNESEIRTLASLTAPRAEESGARHEQRGVDSSATLPPRAKAALVATLARRLRNVVVLTGREDFLSDGRRTVSVRNGHPALSLVTGTGCALGTVVSAFLAAPGGTADVLASSLCAAVYFAVAGEMAAGQCAGPGTFGSAFIDQLYLLRTGGGSLDARWWQSRAMIRDWTVDSQERQEDLQDFDARWPRDELGAVSFS